MIRFCFGLAIGLALALTSYVSYQAGAVDGTNNVVSNCGYYGKHAVDGTQVLLCSGIVDTKQLLDQTLQHASQPVEKLKKGKR